MSARANIPADVAMRAAQRLAAAAGVTLILPGDPRREMVVWLLAIAHLLTGSGWSANEVRQRVSVTLPGAGPVADYLAKVPVVGAVLRALAVMFLHPTIFLSPNAVADPVSLLGTVQHELGHVGQIRAGSLGWCIAYGVFPEVRAGAEAPCYGASMAHDVLLGGVSPEVAEADALAALGGYGLDGDAHTLAVGTIASARAALEAGADPSGGTVAETRAALAAEGWTP